MTCTDSIDLADVVIVGAGPAGLSAALYTARAGLSTLLFGDPYEGQLARAGVVENFPTFKEQVEGTAIVERMLEHATHWGARLREEEVRQIVRRDAQFQLVTERGEAFCAYAVILAMGMKFRRLGARGEEQYYARGVSYCTICDGPLYRDKPVAVAGFGNEAAAAALRMSGIASSVDLVGTKSRLGGDEAIRARLEEARSVRIYEASRVEEIAGDASGVTAIRFTHGGHVIERPVQAVFIEVGTLPTSALAQDLGLELDRGQFIKVVGLQQTSVPGVFAAGDVTGATARQAVISAGDGAKAAIGAIDHIKSLGLSAEKSRLLSIQWGETHVRRAPEPEVEATPVTGPLADYVRKDPAFLANYERYSPDVEAIGRIGAAMPEARVVVVSATWCPDCRRNVPKLAKVAEQLPGWQFEVYPREDEGMARQYAIRAIPTFIVFDPKTSQEVGRVVENPTLETIEADLADIVKRRTP